MKLITILIPNEVSQIDADILNEIIFLKKQRIILYKINK